jgi:hypothetical protein
MLADVLSPIYFSPPGLLVCSVLSLAGIVLIEGTVLRLLRWGSWRITFLHAFIINLISSLVGTGVLIFASQGQFDYAFLPANPPRRSVSGYGHRGSGSAKNTAAILAVLSHPPEFVRGQFLLLSLPLCVDLARIRFSTIRLQKPSDSAPETDPFLIAEPFRLS